MEYGVYMESSLSSSLGQSVFDFLTALAEKAKQVKDFAISFKKDELAEELDISLSSVKRYLKKLEQEDLISVQGVRGQGKGTVVMFKNSDVIRFQTSEEAFVNSDTPISIHDIVEKKIPTKKKPEPKWHRRSDKEIKKANILKNEKQTEVDKLNDELELMGGTPNWAWFEKTAAPVDNYRTYLISAMYNQFAAIFVDDNNYHMTAGNKLPEVTASYNVFGSKRTRFYGSQQWSQLDKFRKFCEEHEIDPAVYLSTQFSRSTFNAAAKNKPKEARPFVNTLWGENAYQVYKDYVHHKKVYKRRLYVENADFVITALQNAYNNAEETRGFNMFTGSIEDFMSGETNSSKEGRLLNFFKDTVKDIEDSNIADYHKDTLKYHLLTQCLIECGGARRIPAHFILSMEMTSVAIQSIKKFHPKDELLLDKALGNMIHPYETAKEQEVRGFNYNTHYHMIDSTPLIFKLIMERQGLAITLQDVNAALKEFGKDRIPHNRYGFIDTDQILSLSENNFVEVVEHTDADMERYTQKSTTQYIQRQYDEKFAKLDDMLENLFD